MGHDQSTLYSASTPTVDNSVNTLHFHLFINLYSHQNLQNNCAESKKRDQTRDSRSHTRRDSLMQQSPRLSAGNQGHKNINETKFAYTLSIDIKMIFNNTFVISTH